MPELNSNNDILLFLLADSLLRNISMVRESCLCMCVNVCKFYCAGLEVKVCVSALSRHQTQVVSLSSSNHLYILSLPLDQIDSFHYSEVNAHLHRQMLD